MNNIKSVVMLIERLCNPTIKSIVHEEIRRLEVKKLSQKEIDKLWQLRDAVEVLDSFGVDYN